MALSKLSSDQTFGLMFGRWVNASTCWPRLNNRTKPTGTAKNTTNQVQAGSASMNFGVRLRGPAVLGPEGAAEPVSAAFTVSVVICRLLFWRQPAADLNLLLISTRRSWAE